MKKVQEFLKECGVYYLATVDNGEPKVRPFGTAEMFDYSYRETSDYRDNEPWATIDDAIEIEEKHRKTKNLLLSFFLYNI